jgi:hypothetical protein
VDALLCRGACESSLGYAVVSRTESGFLVAIVGAVLCNRWRLAVGDKASGEKREKSVLYTLLMVINRIMYNTNLRVVFSHIDRMEVHVIGGST